MPAQSTYTPIATLNGTGTTGGEVLAFTSIPQTYTDLVLVAHATTNAVAGSNTITLSVNTGTGSAYSGTILLGNGTSVSSARFTATTVWYPNNGANLNTTYPSAWTMHFMNYANTATFKPIIAQVASDFAGTGHLSLFSGQFLSTAAINRITISSNQGSNFWTTGSTFTLYGITAA